MNIHNWRNSSSSPPRTKTTLCNQQQSFSSLVISFFFSTLASSSNCIQYVQYVLAATWEWFSLALCVPDGWQFFFKVVYSVPFRDCGNNAAPCFTHCDTGRTAPPVRPLRWRIWPHPPPPPHSTEGLRYIPTITKIIWQNLTRLLTNLPSLLIEPDSVYKVCVCVFLCVTAI